MGKIVNKANFFKERLEIASEAKQETPVDGEKEKPAEEPRKTSADTKIPAVEIAPLELAPAVAAGVRKTIRLLTDLGQKKLAQSVDQAYRDACSELFSVAVVGEFSRGKSTFINAFLGKDVLPVGNLPTTAMLTRIRYHERSVIQCYDKDGKRFLSQPLGPDAWDSLVADNFTGLDPQGTALVGIRDPWLQKTNIELIDTPGAGDLEDGRAKVIGDALLRADGAIITISALQALSMSEKLFIEQRLIARKTPFLMLILTKLDQVPLGDRVGVIDYVRNKLESWNMHIPVFIPYQVDLPNDKYCDILGMDKIKDHILSWRTAPERASLTQSWLIGKIMNALSAASDALLEQKKMLDGKEEERQAKIQQKQELLAKAKLAWGDLQIQMLSRCTKCQKALVAKAHECAGSIVERLQYEANMSGSPQKWWNESYPYRLKIELTNMAATLDAMANRMIAADSKWLNSAMEQQFKTHVLVEKEMVADKSVLGEVSAGSNLSFKDVEKQRTIARVGTTVLTVAGALLCSSLGAYPLIATMGIGTGSSIISEKVFRKELERQKLAIKEAISKNVPELVESAMSESDKRLQAVYNDIIREAEKQEALWMQAQQDSIAKALGATSNDLPQVENRLKEIDSLTEYLHKMK